MADLFLGALPSSDAEISESSRATKRYLVWLDDINKDDLDALAVSGIPSEPISFSGGFLPVVSQRAKRMENSQYFEVEVIWGKPPNNADQDNEDHTNPLADRPTISNDPKQIEEVVLGELDSDRVYVQPVETSAGEVYLPPPTRQISLPVVTLTKNFATTFPPITMLNTYQDSVNSDTFLGASARQWRCTLIKPVEKTRNNVTYLEVKMVLEFKPTHDLILLDYGSYYLDGGVKKSFLTAEGHSRMGYLDGSSGASSETPEYLPAKQIYTAVAFGDSGFPSTVSSYKWVD